MTATDFELDVGFRRRRVSAPSLVVYGDFSCPRSYLASRRLDALAATGVEVDWRAVESDPTLPVTGRLLGASDQHDMASAAALLTSDEDLPWLPPELVPKTQAAVAGYAEAYGVGVGPDVRRVLFAAYWTDGADIGNPEVLRTRLVGPMLRGSSAVDPVRMSGLAVSGNRGPITTQAWRRIAAWRAEWAALGGRDLPVVIDGDGSLAAGEDALRLLEKQFAGEDLRAVPADPGRYPEVAERPGLSWVSQVGGPWARAWMG